MPDRIAWVDGWEVRARPDGTFGVYDDHGMLAGPFGRKNEALDAARKLPHPAGTHGVLPKQTPSGA